MKSTKTLRPTTQPPATLLQPSDPETLRWNMQEMQLAISSRAYELFQARNWEHGHDWEDWFRAETELLRPVSIAISETPVQYSIRANVLGLCADELQIGIEPTRITILGRKQTPAVTETKEATPADSYPEQVLRLIPLVSEVDPRGTVVEFQSGILKFELPKVPKLDRKAAGAGKS